MCGEGGNAIFAIWHFLSLLCVSILVFASSHVGFLAFFVKIPSNFGAIKMKFDTFQLALPLTSVNKRKWLILGFFTVGSAN
jgi:hypothetical protein